MSVSEIQGGRVPVKLWTRVHAIESAALDQLRRIATLPWVYRHVAAMPDVHLGKGATVGSVIAMKDAVSPAAVGVDIGCGMLAARTSLRADQLPDNLRALRDEIEKAVPVGNGPSGSRGEMVRLGEGSLAKRVKRHLETLPSAVDARSGVAARQIGTLGGGNHFIELCVDTEGAVWLMLHSGSRNAGKVVAETHLRIAKTLEHNRRLPDPDLAVFLAGSPEMDAYRRDLFWAQHYASLNREAMFHSCRDVLRKAFSSRGLDVLFESPVQCHHNYVAEERHFGSDVLVTRKGAISARKGELGIIPGSMGTRSYVVRGLGNPESFESASHGAGRRMSRSEARRRFNLADLAGQTKGVECRKDSGVIDEIPGAYKDIDQVMADQADLVEVVAQLRAVLCVKG